MSSLPEFAAIPLAKAVVTSAVLYARWADGLDLRQVLPVSAIAHESTPILLIHGTKDFLTPVSNSQRLASANPRNSLWLVPNAGHTDASAAAPEKYRQRVIDWFREHL
jgi:fermentation-respiration switch protein FrsA (DUF1100 family)